MKTLKLGTGGFMAYSYQLRFIFLIVIYIINYLYNRICLCYYYSMFFSKIVIEKNEIILSNQHNIIFFAVAFFSLTYLSNLEDHCISF